jgi:4-carboxymuconolactone decarboxylase
VDYMERLRRLAISDASFLEDGADQVADAPVGLDAKSLALVRLSALVAVGGAGPSYGAQADAAVDAGATAVEIVDVLAGIIPVVGLPCVVAATPKLALALGYDLTDDLESQSSHDLS